MGIKSKSPKEHFKNDLPEIERKDGRETNVMSADLLLLRGTGLRLLEKRKDEGTERDVRKTGLLKLKDGLSLPRSTPVATLVAR